MHSAMVLLGENRGALAIMRSLGKHKIPVHVGSSRKPSRSHFSRYCSGSFYYPHQNTCELEGMHSEILKNVKKFNPKVLFTLGNVSSCIVFRHAKEYEKYCTLVPNVGYKKFRYFNDKELQLKGANKAGCPTPKTFVAHNESQAQDIAAQIEYPALIKPRVSAAGIGIVKVNNAQELIKVYRGTIHQEKRFYYDVSEPLIQEFVPGDKYTIAGVFDHGKEIASIVFQNYRHYPEFGLPLMNKTVRNEEIRLQIVNMLIRLKWHGPFNVQCVLDNRDDILKLFDFNPRMYALMQSTISAGIDLPHILYQMAIGKKVEKIEGYRYNQTFRYVLFGEAAYFLESKRKMKLASEYLSFKNTKVDIELFDPMPHVVQLFDFLIHRQSW